MKTVSFLSSIIAIAIACMSLWGRSYHLTSESLIAVIAICTTIVVGVHLYDTWTLHKMEEKLEKLSGVNKEIEEMKRNSNIAFHVSWGLSFINSNPKKAFSECWKAFEIAIFANDAIRANTCMKCLESISKKSDLSDMVKLSTELLSAPLYQVFQKRIEDLFKSNKQ